MALCARNAHITVYDVTTWSCPSEVVSTLESRGGGENVPDGCVRKTTEAWHGLVCAVMLRSASACMLASYSGFLATAFAATKVSRCYRRQTLW